MRNEKPTSEGNHSPIIGTGIYTVISDNFIRDSTSEKDPRNNQDHIFGKQIFCMYMYCNLPHVPKYR